MLMMLAVRNLLRHPWRTLATVFGVAIGIAAVLSTLSVGANIKANIRSNLEASAGGAELIVAPGAQGRAVLVVDDVLDAVRDTEGVEEARPVLNVPAAPLLDLQASRDAIIPGLGSVFQLSGRLTEPTETLAVTLIAGALPERGSGGVALTSSFAGNRGVSLGEEVVFVGQRGRMSFILTGLLDDGAGIASSNAGRIGIVHLSDLQAAAAMAGRASILEVSVAGEDLVSRVRNALQSNLGDAYTVTLPAGSAAIATGIVDTLEAGLRVLAATLVALAGFIAYNTFAVSVLDRKRELALLRIIALTRRRIQRLALLEALLVGLLGAVAGVALGIALSYGITRLNAFVLGYEYRTLVLPLSSIGLAISVGIGASLLAGLLPARVASRTPPIVAARNVEDGSRPPYLGLLFLVLSVGTAVGPWPDRWTIPGAALSMALLFLGVLQLSPFLLRGVARLWQPVLTRMFGVAGTLGGSFALRNAHRNGVAVSAVVIGTSLIIGVGAMVAGINSAIADWVDSTIVGDLFVSSSVGFPPEFVTELRQKVPAIDEASGVVFRVVRFEPGDGGAPARSVALILVDPARFDPENGFGRYTYLEGDEKRGFEALAAGGKVLAGSTIRARFGIELGDSVSLQTSEGFRRFPVEGIIVDFWSGGETFVASLADLEHFGGGSPDSFVMTVKAGADARSVELELARVFPDLYLDIALSESYRGRILTLMRQSFATTNGLLFLAIVIASLGVANTLGMNLSSRQHEIAVFRAVCLTRSGIRRLISSEGIIITTLGMVLGIAAGLLFSNIIVASANSLTGFAIYPSYPWRLIAISLLASPLLGFVASHIPARRAASLPPAAALGRTT